MSSFRFFWTAHKWTGIILSLLIIVIAITGVLLLFKKRFDWIQAPTARGQAGAIEEFLPLHEIVAAALAAGNEHLQTIDDIDRIDVRPRQRAMKVRSIGGWAEVQICAVTGEVLDQNFRTSDFLEQIHDGSIIGDWFKEFVMPVVPAALLFLTASGFWLWLEPMVRRRRRLRRQSLTAGRADEASPRGGASSDPR